MRIPVRLDQLCEIAYLAGGVMKTYFTHFGMERVVKTDTTPLTAADTEINALVISHIRKLSTEVDIVGEEESDRTDSPWQIMCDPVDGTFPYTWGMPVATFMLGLMYRREPVMGVIYDPFTDRMYSAQKGKGAWLNMTRLKVSRVATRKWPELSWEITCSTASDTSLGADLAEIVARSSQAASMMDWSCWVMAMLLSDSVRDQVLDLTNWTMRCAASRHSAVSATSAMRIRCAPGFIPCASRARKVPGKTVTL